ncbi:MAG: hypothetical protein WAX04_03770, partial [Oscillospiraceae bacterium]
MMSLEYKKIRDEGIELGLVGVDLKSFIDAERRLLFDLELAKQRQDAELKLAEKRQKCDELKVQSEIDRQAKIDLENSEANKLKLQYDQIKLQSEIDRQAKIDQARIQSEMDRQVIIDRDNSQAQTIKLRNEQEHADIVKQKLLLEVESLRNQNQLEQHRFTESIRFQSKQQELDQQIALEKICLDRIRAEGDLEIQRQTAQSASETNLETRVNFQTSGIKELQKLVATDRQVIENYFERFEKICTMENIAKENWAKLIAPKLTGPLADILVRLPLEDALNYDKLRDAIFDKYLLDADYFRFRFYGLRQTMGESCAEFFRRLKTLLEKWLHAESVDSSYEEIFEFILKNQFWSVCRKEDSARFLFLKERASNSLEEISRISDVYSKAHVDPKKICADFVREPNSYSNYQRRPYQTGSAEKPQVSNIAIPRPPDRFEQLCNHCHLKGHIEAACYKLHPELRRPIKSASQPNLDVKGGFHNKPHAAYKKSAGMCPVKIIEFQNLETESPDLDFENKIVESSENIKILGGNQMVSYIDRTNVKVAGVVPTNENCLPQNYKTLDPFTQGTVNGFDVKVMRDTGSFTSVVKAKYVKPEQYTNKTVTIQFADG